LVLFFKKELLPFLSRAHLPIKSANLVSNCLRYAQNAWGSGTNCREPAQNCWTATFFVPYRAFMLGGLLQESVHFEHTSQGFALIHAVALAFLEITQY
jgi:hypothetical protein